MKEDIAGCEADRSEVLVIKVPQSSRPRVMEFLEQQGFEIISEGFYGRFGSPVPPGSLIHASREPSGFMVIH